MGVGSDDSSSLRTCVMVCLAVSFNATAIWLLNVTAYPGFNSFFPMARDIATTLSGVLGIALAAVATRRPHVFAGTGIFAVAVTSAVMGVAGMFAASWLQSPALATLFACMRTLADLMGFVYTGLALLALSPQRCIAVLICAYLLKYALMAGLLLLPDSVLPAAFLVMQTASISLMYVCAKGPLGELRCIDSQENLSVTNPLSFLPFTNRLFVAILLFKASLGFAITYGSMESFPQPTILAAAGFAVVALVAFVRKSISLDSFYAMAFVLVLAGMLAVPGIQAGVSQLGDLGVYTMSVSNALLQAGSEVINISVWLLAAALSRRNLVGALPAMLVICGANGIGVEVGAASGLLQNYLSTGHPALAILFPTLIAFAFAVYNFFLARSFSFDATVRGLQPIAPVKELDERDDDRGSQVDRRCRELTEASHLTERESQVLALLARGRNAAYIQESLSLSRNTIKSYVARVYGKLGVHSHQEVIDLVEQGLEADGR